MGQALYRKYRSKSLSEIIGQEHITDTLKNALKTGRISHAYLFTGPRGVGKTSIARILAHEINQLPYDEDQSHIDIIEIDAASNRRIDEIRDLRDKVYIAPAQAKYKVYIIDEVHMLTREAFNALLKTLEEPPAHAVFILATTEAHKLPETIVSRTQRFIFRPIEPAKVVAHLRDIAAKEKIDISDDALELVAKHGDGSFRDSISLLDQLAGLGGHIDAAAVQASLGIPPDAAVADLLAALGSQAAPSSLVGALTSLEAQGFQPAAIAKSLASKLRSDLLDGHSALGHAACLKLLAQLLEVPASHNPERYLEVILLGATHPQDTAVLPSAAPTRKPQPAKVAEPPQVTEKKPAPIVTPKPARQSKPEQPPEPAAPTAAESAMLDDSIWAEVLGTLKSQHNTLYGIIRMAQPDFSETGKLALTFAFAFHQKRVNEAKNQQILAGAIAKVTGGSIIIECRHDPDLKLAKKQTEPQVTAVPEHSDQAAPLATISNIFGGGELLNSK